MAIILGVVFVVMLVMNGALFYVLATACAATKRQVDACFVQELEAYDEFLDEKKEEGKRLEAERDEIQDKIRSMEGVMLSLKTSPFYAPRPISRELYVPTARYIDNEFFDNHKLVNDKMKDVDQMGIVREIRRRNRYRGDREEYESADRLLKFLGMETAYELCTIQPEEQVAVLRENLEGREAELLERYLKELSEEQDFDVLDFRTYVREIHTLQDPNMYIRTGRKEVSVTLEENLVHQYDSNISEGLKIIYQNRVFDFSIYRLRSRK